MLKNKVAIILLTVVMLFCIVFISSCGNSNLIKDGEYNAVLVARSIFWSSWITDFKVEIKSNKLYIDNEEAGELSAGKVSQDNWDTPAIGKDDWKDPWYKVVDGVDLDTLMTIEDCFVIDSKVSDADCFYLISSNNNYYLLLALQGEECPWIFRVYLLDEIGGGNEA